MLQSLSVKNFILIDELDLEFEKGLCVITGETGAGKSILLDAILFCLGDKFSENIIKSGCEYCSVTATFMLNNNIKTFLEQIGIELNNELLIKCIQKVNNRKKFLINDQVTTQGTVQQLAEYLFEFHGQNSHTSLLKANLHIDILDNYGNLADERTALYESFKILQKITKEIEQTQKERHNIEQEINYLAFVTKEIETLDIQENEEEQLTLVRQKLQTSDKEIKIIQDILTQLQVPEIDGAISKAQRILSRALPPEHELASVSSDLDLAYNYLEEARTKLQYFISNLTENEYNLENIEDRLFAIRSIARKHNINSTEILDFYKKSSTQLNILRNKISNIGELEEKQIAAHENYLKLAKTLSHNRSTYAKKLQQVMQLELEQLKMEKALFKVDITPSSEEGSNGIDDVRFVASINPGMSLAPIDKIASGGELSRFMLALKTSLFDKLYRPLVIFDEVDTGIGGIVADKVGERLKKLSAVTQVIVITHQPQVASKASKHILVSKMQSDKKTYITAHDLDFTARQKELARMISGKYITKASMDAAKELLTS